MRIGDKGKKNNCNGSENVVEVLFIIPTQSRCTIRVKHTTVEIEQTVCKQKETLKIPSVIAKTLKVGCLETGTTATASRMSEAALDLNVTK